VPEETATIPEKAEDQNPPSALVQAEAEMVPSATEPATGAAADSALPLELGPALEDKSSASPVESSFRPEPSTERLAPEVVESRLTLSDSPDRAPAAPHVRLEPTLGDLETAGTSSTSEGPDQGHLAGRARSEPAAETSIAIEPPARRDALSHSTRSEGDRDGSQSAAATPQARARVDATARAEPYFDANDAWQIDILSPTPAPSLPSPGRREPVMELGRSEREVARPRPALGRAGNVRHSTGADVAIDRGGPVAALSPRPPRKARRALRRGGAFLLGVATTILAAMVYLQVTGNWRLVGQLPSVDASSPAARTIASLIGSESAPDSPAPEAAATPGSMETPPPIEAGRLLSLEELRYCVFQAKRLNFLFPKLKGNGVIQRYNALVRDYTARCNGIRFDTAALSTAQGEAAAGQSRLQAEAAAILTSWTEAPTGELIDLGSARGAAQVQAKLKALGYYQGIADGVWGAKSQAALARFREEKGLGHGAGWDIATQTALLGP
jgi:hypothetical protein